MCQNHYFKASILNKSFCKATAKISNEFYQRELTIINFVRIFGTSGMSIHFHSDRHPYFWNSIDVKAPSSLL